MPYGRSGLPIWNFRALNKYIEALEMPNTVIDCECMVDQSLEDAMSVYGFDFSKTVDDFTNPKTGKVSKSWEKYQLDLARCEALQNNLQAAVIDVLTLEEFTEQKCTRIYEERRAYIENDFALQVEIRELSAKIRVDKHEIFNSLEDALERGQEVIQRLKLEGLIIKELKGTYEFKRSPLWVKIKEEVELDVVVLECIVAKQTFAPNGDPEPPMVGKFKVTDGVRTFEVGTGKGWTKEFYQHAYNHPEEFVNKVWKLTAQRLTEDSAICPRFGCDRPDKLAHEILSQ